MKKTSLKKLTQSVKTKLVLIIVAIMVIPLVASIIVSYSSSHSEAVANMDAMNTAQAGLVEHDFKSVVEQNMQVLQAVSNSPEVKALLKGETDTEAVAAWMKRVDDEFGDGNSLIVDNADGMQIVRTVGECVDVSDREYFKTARDTGKFYVSDQNISKSTGQRICTFIHPVLDEGTFIGAVQRNYNLDDFTELVKNEVTEENQDIFIGDNNGDLIAHTSMDLNTGEAVNFASQQWYSASRDNPEAKGDYDSNFGGTNWRMSYQREPITGWVTVVASDKAVALAESNRMLGMIVTIGMIMMIAAAVIAVILANSFTKPILQINSTIARLSEGEFITMDDRKLIARKDEFGDIVRHVNSLVEKLTEVVENAKSASDTASQQARDLSDTSQQISDTTDGVSEAVQEMAKGATDQADNVQKATENIGTLSDAIQNVAERAEALAGAAAEMNDASQQSSDALQHLSDNMNKMGQAVREISDTMQETNGAVEKVNEKVDGITSIASQTNLLALNASIEAARAGEAGRGFAVVAEEIGKLATESAQTAGEIKEEMSNLLTHSGEATRKTEEVSAIGREVIQVLSDTVAIIDKLIENVSSTVDGVNTISGLTEECNASKEQIVDAMSSLSAISEQNAASTQETGASMQELNATVNGLAASAGSLHDVAEKLDEELGFFKI